MSCLCSWSLKVALSPSCKLHGIQEACKERAAGLAVVLSLYAPGLTLSARSSTPSNHTLACLPACALGCTQQPAQEVAVQRGKDGHLTLDSIRGGSSDFFSASKEGRGSRSGETHGGWGAGGKAGKQGGHRNGGWRAEGYWVCGAQWIRGVTYVLYVCLLIPGPPMGTGSCFCCVATPPKCLTLAISIGSLAPGSRAASVPGLWERRGGVAALMG